MNANATPALATPGRAALYLRVSPGRQAEQDLSIPDQRRQPLGYCEARGIEVVAEFVEPGATATDDKRPSFQRMMDEASQKPGTRVCREL
jgi:DNA invertase Pin-like site-specific DNA recombinase